MRRFDFGAVFRADGTFIEAHSVVEEQGIIRAVGATSDLASTAATAEVIDCRNFVALPGFVDGHSHFPDIGLWTQCWMQVSSDDDPANSIDEVLSRLSAWSRSRDFKGWVLGYGLLEEEIAEARLPNRAELDTVCSRRPVVLFDRTMHRAVVNSVFIERHFDGTSTPEVDAALGLFREDGLRHIVKVMPRFDYDDYLRAITYAQQVYLRNGFTTVQVGALKELQYLDFILKAHDEGKLLPKVVVWPMLHTLNELSRRDRGSLSRSKVRLGAIKLFCDGEFNLRSASSPRLRSTCPGCAISRFDAERIAQSIRALAPDHDLAVHANGDEAIRHVVEQLKAHSPRQRRHIVVHATLYDPGLASAGDQPEITPTFLSSRIKYWKDRVLEDTFGEDRHAIFPAGSVAALGVRFSIHTDAPVSPVSSADLLEAATQRRTRDGTVIGESERLDLATALLAMTAYPAWQNRLDDVGAIEPGKAFDICLYGRTQAMTLQTFSAPARVYVDGELVFDAAAGASSAAQSGSLSPDTERPAITRAERSDAHAILVLQRIAFESEAMLYKDRNIAPLTESLEALQRDFESHVVLKATLRGRLVGTIRATENDGCCVLRKMSVLPQYQGRWLGVRLMREIENLFPNVRKFQLFTGYRSERNIGLYLRLGYKVTHVEDRSPGVSLVHMEKPAPLGVATSP